MSAGDYDPFRGFVVGSIVFCPDAVRLAQMGDFMAQQRHNCGEQTLRLQVGSLTARVRELEDLLVGPDTDANDAYAEWQFAVGRERRKIKEQRL